MIFMHKIGVQITESLSARTYISYNDALIFSKYISEIKIKMEI